MYTCRECERELNQATEICPYCGADLLAEQTPAELPAKKPRLFSLLLRYAILLAAIWAFLVYVLPERRSGEARIHAETRATETMREVAAVLSSYAGAQSGDYPASLEALPTATAEKIRSAAQRALAEGYRLEYALRNEEVEGGHRHFILTARPGNWGYRSFYIDETGVLRSTREDRAATAQDPTIP